MLRALWWLSIGMLPLGCSLLAPDRAELMGGACEPGLGDCSDDVDGCETDLRATPEHCGGCDHDCQGRLCLDGFCEPILLVSGLTGEPIDIAVNESHACWIEVNGTVGCALLLDTSNPTTLTGQPYQYGSIALTATHIYWTTETTVSCAGLDLQMPPLTVPAVGPRGIAVNDMLHMYAFFVEQAEIARVPLCGAAFNTKEMVATLTDYHELWRIAVTAQDLYATDNVKGGSVYQAPPGGGPPSSVAVNQASPYDIVADSADVYWTNAGDDLTEPQYVDGHVVKKSQAGGEPARLAQVGYLPYSIKVDATHVYWSSDWDGTASKIAKQGGEVVPLAQGAFHIAIDDQWIYWVDRNDGEIRKAPK